jgi:leucine dehydrogenase
LEKADDIYDTMLTVFEIARAERIPPHEAADRLAERRLEGAKKERRAKA